MANGVTQYIGARYVPAFYTNGSGTSEWTANTQYEPLTIVTWNGNSYTSKKPVPANIGSPDTAPEYWVSTGIYNQQVEQYRQIVEALQADVEDFHTEYDNAHPKKYVFLGDSYNNPTYGNWGPALAGYLGLAEADYRNLYQDGGSFYAGNLLTKLRNSTSDITPAMGKEYGAIVVLAGINDAHTDTHDNYDAVTDGISAFCAWCKGKFPNATVYLGFVGNSIETSTILNGRDWENIAKALGRYARCGEFGAKFIPNLEYVLHDYSLMGSDGIHPTAAGGQEIARYTASALKTGGVDVKREMRTPDLADIWDRTTNMTEGLTVNLLNPTFLNRNFTIYQDNATQLIQFRYRIALIFAETHTLGNGEQFLCGVINTPLWKAKPGLIIPISGSAKKADNTYVSVKAHLTINSGKVYLRMDQIGDDWTQTNVNVTQILFPPFDVCVPTMMC